MTMTSLRNRWTIAIFSAAAVNLGWLATPQSVSAMTFERLSFGGMGRLETQGTAIGSLAKIDFAELVNQSMTYGTPGGSAFGVEFVGGANTTTDIVVQDIDELEKTVTNPAAGPSQEVNRWERDWGAASIFQWLTGDDWTFTLNRMVLRESNHNGSVLPQDRDLTADVFGYFTFSDNTVLPNTNPGNALTAQADFVLSLDGDSYSANLSTIPTPAMLPGLFAMGLGAWRKSKLRRDSDSELGVK
ncbi:PTPA-CTERM sorting domain-containing protein [filamentous cyanobacterium LEGE 11480]|uniref:PTPA-CTERM sorting domain-containing protein n=1 Tax=Romeriopsis navalis LEGE 11480 TaxID=2777977 RepID=A0A928Z3R1_9CYAN|nr:PTPA-CTERM sorting domain-containing protein [Romeriopsis navalis]MBE9029508.1 PTPA-CTERM sorting domain-containing protein [Romeriopsis navalis LEGE 11480]